MNWFLQIFSIALFNLRSIPERKGAAIAVILKMREAVMVPRALGRSNNVNGVSDGRQRLYRDEAC